MPLSSSMPPNNPITPVETASAKDTVLTRGSSNEKPHEPNTCTASDGVVALEAQVDDRPDHDVFGDETNAEVHYKTCEWWYVAYRSDETYEVIELL